jgi:hypothetical protein
MAASTREADAAKGLEGAFDGILRQYGTNVAQVSTVVAVVIGSLGFSDYFNAGAWTLLSVVSFALAYMYRRQTPANLPKTTAWVIVFLMMTAGLPLAIGIYHLGWDAFLKSLSAHKTFFSAYSAFVVTLSVAILITSYKKQELYSGGKFPDKLENAIASQLYQCPFYREKIFYDIEIVDCSAEDKTLNLKTTLTYNVTNRSDDPEDYPVTYTLKHELSHVEQVSINKKPYDPQSPEYQFGRGIKIVEKIPPRATYPVSVLVFEQMYLGDSDMYTTYYAASDLRVRVMNPFPDLIVDFELWYPDKTLPPGSGTTREVVLDKGVLPFQGVRINWKERKEPSNEGLYLRKPTKARADR